MHRTQLQVSLLGFVFSFALVLGCGQNEHPELRHVTGTVLYQGNPVEDAVVAFHNEEAVRLASGKTDTNGEFSLTSFQLNDGALPGEHRIVVTKVADAEDGPSLSMDEAVSAAPRRTKRSRYLLPKKYSSKATTPLVLTVSEEGANDVEIVLED